MEMLGILLILCLLAVCAMLICFIILLKREMKSIKSELMLTRENSYNRQMTVSLIDKDLSALTAEINYNLDYQKQLKLKTEQLNRQLKQSVSDIAHDLRTPLTVIKGNLQMLEQEGGIAEHGRVYYEICRDKTDELKETVDNFFELSVLESDDLKAAVEPVNIINIIMRFLLEHEAVIRERELEPQLSLPQKSVMILADEKMLCRMLSNLLNNILKYARHDFFVTVRTEQNKKSCEIIFSNRLENGDSADIKHIFERNFRGSNDRRGSGAGLGLYIVKLLADKQGASVRAEQKEDMLEIGLSFQTV